LNHYFLFLSNKRDKRKKKKRKKKKKKKKYLDDKFLDYVGIPNCKIKNKKEFTY